MNKKLYKEMKKVSKNVFLFYNWSRSKGQKDKKSRMIARQGDLLARDILVLISKRVNPDAEGLVAAMIALTQTHAFLEECVPYGLDEGLQKMLDNFQGLFRSDFWRWIKHDAVQSGYERLFRGHGLDGDDLVRRIDNMLAREDLYYNNETTKKH